MTGRGRAKDRNAQGGRGRGRPNTSKQVQAMTPGTTTKKFMGNHDKLQG